MAASCGAVGGSVDMFCNSESADRSGMAASRFLAAADACVIRLRFAAEIHKSPSIGSVKVAKPCEWCFGSRFF